MADEELELKNPNSDFEVRGHVTRASKASAARLRILIYDQDLRKRQKLTETTTNEDGSYRATYRSEQFAKAEQGTADLVVVVLDDDDETLATSSIRFNARPLETIDLVISDPAPPPKSEYEITLEAVLPLLVGQDVELDALEQSAEHQDLSFLAQETALGVDRIGALVNAAKLQQQAQAGSPQPQQRAAASAGAAAKGAIPWQPAFYGLLRQGTPASLSSIVALTPAALQSAFGTALRRNLIPAALAKQIDAIIAGLSAIKASQVLQPAAGSGVSLGDLLNSSLPQETRTAVAQLYAQSGADVAALQTNGTQGGSLQQVESAGDLRKFITSLDAGAITASQSKQVKAALAFNQLASSYAPLVQELTRMGNADATSMDPTALATLTQDDWLQILARPKDPQQPAGGAIGHPAGFASDADYAQSLAKTVAKTYPTAAFAAGLAKDAAAASPFASTHKDLTTFLKNNPAFVLGQVRIDDYLAQNSDQKLGGIADRVALTARVHQLERLSRFAPGFAPARALLADGIGSAQAAAALGASRFIQNYGAAFATAAEAKQAYAKARTVTLAALKTYFGLGRASNLPQTMPLDSGVDGPVNTGNFNPTDQANWTALFGSIDLCDCEDCQALDSAAAYFVDVLDFLRQGSVPAGAARQPLPGAVPPSALDALLKRRPDLANIELSCDNTNVRLPYVDLVNEVLEAAVADPSLTLAAVDPATLDLRQISQPLQTGLSLTSQALVDIETKGSAWAVRDTGWRYEVTKDAHQGVDVHPYPQTSGTEEELAANPQHINYKAYALLAQAGYPWSLPLNLPAAEARAYLQQLKVARSDVMAALLPPAQRLANDDVANEQLGLSSLAAGIITGTKLSDPANTANAGVVDAPWTFWGLDKQNDPALPTGGNFNGSWDQALQGVPLFLSQSGLKYPQLLDLLNTYFLNPKAGAARTLSIVSTNKNEPATCDVDLLALKGLTPAILSKIHRFVRLQTALGLGALDLDRALTALGAADLAVPVPRQLAHVRMLQKQLSQPLAAILAFYAPIDSAVYADTGGATTDPTVLRSLYIQLFRSQSLGSPADPAFTEDPQGLSVQNGVQIALTDHTATILGALRLSADDLTALVSGTNAVIANTSLTLANLSALYRHAVLAQSLQLSISDLLRARVMFGDPFASPETTLWFVRRVAAVRASGFDIATLSYLLRHDISDAAAQSTLSDQFASTLSSLRDQLEKVASDNVLTADPKGVLTRAKLTLLKWNDTYIAQAIALLGDANSWSAPLAALPAGLVFPGALADRMEYDAVAQVLSLRGVLSTPDFNTLKNIPQGAADAPYQQALQTLFTNSRADAQTFLVDRMRAFELPAFVAPPAPQVLAPVVIPDVWQSRIQYNAATSQLTVNGALTEAELAALLALPLGAPFQQAVQSLFDQAKQYLPDAKSRFLVRATNADTAADPAHTAFADLFDGTAMPADRFAYVLTRVCTYIRRTRSEGAATQTLSSAFNLDPAAVSELLTSVLVAPSDATQPAMADLVAAGFVASAGDVSGAFYAPQIAVLTRMQKISTIALGLKLTSDLISLVDQLHGPANWLDWNALPVVIGAPVDVKLWEALMRALGLRSDLLTATQLEDLLTQANTAPANKATFIKALAAATDWSQADIEAWMGIGGDLMQKGLLNLTYPDDFKGGGGLRRLRRVFALMATIGASPQQLADWSPLDLAADPPPVDPWPHAVSNATAIKNAVRAKYTDDVWLTTAAPIRNGLRELQRTALVAYLITRHLYGKDDVDLYDYFLIDVDMGACMKTTRLVQAICSVQLYVQRCLLNLESGVQLSADQASEWNQWRSLYRVWEANRLVLLYPENWLVPAQRDDKTPPFVDFENELQQNDVTSDTATTALRHYLEQVDLVGRLEIVAICVQQLSLVSLDDEDTTHVFGRTYASPHTYFHRQWRAGAWSPWEQVDLDIDGDHLIATVWNNHLYLCWPQFSEKSDPQNQSDRANNADPTRYWEIKLAWSEFLDGKWQSKHVSAATETLRYDEHPELKVSQTPDDVRFLASVIPGDSSPVLVIDCYGLSGYTVTTPPPATPVPPDMLLLIAPQANVTVITFSLNGATPSDADLANIVVHARKDSDQTLMFTNLAQKFDSVPGVLPGFNPFDPAWDTIIAAIAIALKISPIYGVVALDLLNTLDFSLDGSAPFSINKISTPWTPPGLAWINVDLAPRTIVTPGATTTIITQIDPIGRFEFSTCRSDVTALPKYQTNPPMLPLLTPPPNTFFEDEMIVESASNVTDTLGAKGTLGRTPGVFRLQTEAIYIAGKITIPLAYQDDTRTYFVTAVTRASGLMTHFQVFFHPQICSFIATLDRFGADGLLTLANQSVTDPDPCIFKSTYQPNPQYVDLDDPQSTEERTPREIVEFAPEGAYSIYNWEIFFHIPFMVATQLSANQRFDEARHWFHYIFDPTSSATGGRERFWKFKPFFDAASLAPATLEDLIDGNSGELERESVALAADPFEPFLVARMRPLAFMKEVVMAYLDNLIAWGDQLFARDTMESVNEATQLYVLAARILGRRPDAVPPRANPVVQTFNTLPPTSSGVFLDALVAIESYIFPSGPPSGGKIGKGTGSLGTMPLFCIPKDDKLLGYWDAIDLRLFRIRHCMNAEGEVRDLAPFAPFIDPGLLVAATAAGVDLDSILDDLAAPLPAYRFTAMLQKAIELTSEVRALGSEMLSALEKRDAERLALLRATHELNLARAVKQIKTQQVSEANANLAALNAYQTVVTARQQYYQTREFINNFEAVHIQLSSSALIPLAMQIESEIAGAILHLVPDVKLGAPTTDGITYGGTNIGAAVQAFGGAMGSTAGVMNAMGSLSATLGGYRRRQDEWDFQADLATKELAQVAQQITAATIRASIAQGELDNQDLQITQSQDVYDYLKGKYTNAELYDWMVSQLSTIYFQSYKLAYEMAKRAERAYRHDLGLTDSNFIQFGYWDSLKKGLMAGERLQFDLRRMESDYLQRNQREQEIVKHVSLLLHDPLALLQLKETGQCDVDLPEMMFDVDFPGHYLRRIKTVSLSIPCVIGPYASINCQLTLLKSKIRTTNTPTNPYAEQANNDTRFYASTNPIQSIAVSQGQNDSGLFELNLRDERYLPFEGEGVISTWRLQLATDFKSFDHGTISDAILHLRYTARDGGDDLRQNAAGDAVRALNAFVFTTGQKGLARLFSLRDDFPVVWDQFKNPPLANGDQTATVNLDKSRFPLLFQSRTLNMANVIAFAKPAAGFESTYTAAALKLTLQAGNAAVANALKLTGWNDFLRSASVQAPPLAADAFASWTLAAWVEAGGAHQRLDPKGLEDIVLLVGYTVT
jgi:hypothetical protein